MNEAKFDSSRLKFSNRWILLNSIGAIAFLFCASFSWVEPNLRDIPGASGGGGLIAGMLFLLTMPLIILGNILAVARLIARMLTKKQWLAAKRSWLILLIWFMAIVVNLMNQGSL